MKKQLGTYDAAQELRRKSENKMFLGYRSKNRKKFRYEDHVKLNLQVRFIW